jgi:hypothetical protein
MALVSAGARTQIASLDEQSTAARTCKLFYDNTRDELLAEAQWDFANKNVTAALISSLPGAPGNNDTSGSTVWIPEYPAPGWLYQYGYPEDCITLRWVIPQGPWGYWLAQAQTDGPWNGLSKIAVPFAVTNSAGVRVVNTNAQQAIFAYTMRVTNPAIYPQDFSQALSGRLAARLVIPLAGDKVLAQGAFNAANEIVARVRAQNANESMDVIDNIPDWQKARDWPDWYGGPPGWWLQGGGQ